jgi:hypothetical protein
MALEPLMAGAALERADATQYQAEPGLRFFYNALGVPIAAGTRYPVRPAVESQDRRGGHDFELDFGRRRCAATQSGAD